MVSHLFYYQLAVLALAWLFVMLHCGTVSHETLLVKSAPCNFHWHQGTFHRVMVSIFLRFKYAMSKPFPTNLGLNQQSHMTQDIYGKQVLPTSPSARTYKKTKAEVPNPCGPQLLPLRVMSGSAHLTSSGAHAIQHWTPDSLEERQ